MLLAEGVESPCRVPRQPVVCFWFGCLGLCLYLGFLLRQVLGQRESGLVKEFAHWRNALHESGEEVGSACLAVSCTTSIVPYGHLVDVETLDGIHLSLHQIGQLLQQEQ